MLLFVQEAAIGHGVECPTFADKPLVDAHRLITNPTAASAAFLKDRISTRVVTADLAISYSPFQLISCFNSAPPFGSGKAAELSGAQDQKRTTDQIATGVAIVVFWPAAFLVGGDGQVAAQLAQMKGQMNAIEQASIQKKCGIQFRQAPDAAS